MDRVLESYGIEPNPDYDGQFFDQMQRCDWMSTASPSSTGLSFTGADWK